MKCDKCKKNEANFHKVSNVNGKVSEIHLCSECAKNSKEFNLEKEFNSFNNHSFIDDFMSDFKTSFSYFTNPLLDNFLDFDSFDSILNDEFFSHNLLEDNPKKENEKSNKKVDLKLNENEKIKLEINKLDIELKKAVVEERYEDAVVLRDKIKSLKEKIK